MSELIDQATAVAKGYLADSLPRRWTHVQAVAAKAAQLAKNMPDEGKGQLLIAAAWLHDIGYAPDVVDTGLHALDGARRLLRDGLPDRLAALVAHHSCAVFEAAERGLARTLAAEFPYEQSAVSDALWYADMTTGPDGEEVNVEERLREIQVRYGPDHLVTRFWTNAKPTLLEAVQRTENRMSAQPM